MTADTGLGRQLPGYGKVVLLFGELGLLLGLLFLLGGLPPLPRGRPRNDEQEHGSRDRPTDLHATAIGKLARGTQLPLTRLVFVGFAQVLLRPAGIEIVAIDGVEPGPEAWLSDQRLGIREAMVAVDEEVLAATVLAPIGGRAL